MDRLFRNRRTRLRNLLLLILPFCLLVAFFGFMAFRSLSGVIGNTIGNNSSSKYVIESMGYTLRSDATDLQKECFKELSKAVEDGSDKGEIARLVAKNYIADFYTWTNKNGSYDVGGLCYIANSQKANVFNRARNTFYKYVSYYINELGKENLLEVADISVEGGNVAETYTLDNKSYDSYFITVRWDYKNLDKLSAYTNNWVTKLYVNVIENEDGRFEIMEVYGDE